MHSQERLVAEHDFDGLVMSIAVAMAANSPAMTVVRLRRGDIEMTVTLSAAAQSALQNGLFEARKIAASEERAQLLSKAAA